MHNFSSFSIDKNFLLSALALCLSISWLIPIHQVPWLSFNSDALAALVLLLPAWLIVFKTQVSFRLDALGLAVVLCIISVWSQYLFGEIASFGTAWIYALYLMGFLLAMLIGRAWQQKNPYQCSDFIFTAVLLGGLLSVVVQLCQLFEIGFSGGFVLPLSSSRYFANLGQSNQLGSLLMLSILACAWFYIKGSVNGVFWLTLTIALAFGLAMTGSRTGWLNMSILAAGLFFYRNRGAAKKLLPGSIGLLVFYFSFVFFQPWVFIKNFFGYALGDIAVRTILDEARLQIWKGLISSRNDYFLTGYGWGQIPNSQTFYANSALDLGGMVVQSHNLFFDLVLWVGLPVGFILFGLFFLWAFKLLYKLNDIRVLLMVFFLLVLFVHSMLEFPLHYAYFLLPAGLMAGAISQLTDSLAIKLPRFMVLLVLVVSTVAYSVTVKDYFIVEKGFLGLRFKQNGIQGVEAFPSGDIMVLTHLRDYIVFTTIDPLLHHSETDINLGRKVISSFPSALGIYNFAAMLAFSGESQEAEFWLNRICKINNKSQCQIMEAYWTKLVDQNPSISHVRFEH